ncbi:hypothetical protein HFX_5274 (plasmid) [Haloferax mediterranei ATCC 33500]|nr:hypothetical protein HFX_5274 [Haloferax mediterranei ATCC 33500]
MAILGGLLVLVVVFSQICLFVALIARQILVYFTYALFPLLIIFWVADAGPLKHGKNLSEKFFKATGMLIPGGILVAGILAVGMKFTSETISTFSGAATATGVDATFSDPFGAVINLLIIPLAIAATSLLPSMKISQWLSGAGLGSIPTPSPGQALSKSKNTISNLRRGSISGGIGSGGMGGGGISSGGVVAQARETGQQAAQSIAADDSGSAMAAVADGGNDLDNVSVVDSSEDVDSDDLGGFNHPGFDDIEIDPDKPGYSSENMETGAISTTDEYTMVDARREASAETDGFTSDGFRFYADDPTDEQRDLREKRARKHYMEKSEDFSELSITDFTEDEFADLTADQQSRLQFRALQSQQEYLEDQSDGAVEGYIKEAGKTALSGTATTVATAAVASQSLPIGIGAILGIGAAAGALGYTFQRGVESQDHRLSAGGIYGGLKNATGKAKNTFSRSDSSDSASESGDTDDGIF